MRKAALAMCAAILVGCASLLFAQERPADTSPPRSLDANLKIQLFAEHPRLVTPTGIDVDGHGRVWVIESNTHFPPAGYKGHPTDRLLVLQDEDSDGAADRIVTFADGFTHAMSVAVRPGGSVYVATRREVTLLRDENGDDRPETRTRILYLDTPGDYPHNGLAGFAFDALGNMYIGLGENLGAAYKLVGSDGKTIAGGGEGGNLYRCRLDGSGLTHVATGFWNPHASCFDAFGRLFTVDNDPDSRPPCRLLHILEGGDYGYRFRNGRRGIHPFTAWDGELPGTLPMLAGTGEAPSGIVSYESGGLPADYIGNLLVTSWGDHRIDRFRLKPKGCSFTSLAEPVIVGGENFRPVGLAVAPDGSLFCSDWVLKDYSVHGKGRVWHIAPVNPPQRVAVDIASFAKQAVGELQRHLESPRVDVRRAAAQALAERNDGLQLLRAVLRKKSVSTRGRMEAWWALQRTLTAEAEKSDPQGSKIAWELAYPDDEIATAEYRGHPVRSMQRFAVDVLAEKNGRATDPYLEELQRPRSRDPLYPLACLPGYMLHRSRSQETFPAALFEIDDPFVFAETVRLTAETTPANQITELMKPEKQPATRARLGLLLAARRQFRTTLAKPAVALGLADPDPAIQRAAVQWVGEESLAGFRPRVEEILGEKSVTPDLLEAVLATLEMLDGVKRQPKDEHSGAEYVLKLLQQEDRPANVRALALRMLPADHAGFNADLARKLLAEKDSSVRLEAVRTLSWSKLPERDELLRRIAADEQAAAGLRAEAIAGLATAKATGRAANVLKLLISLLDSRDQVLRIESLRALRTLASGSEAARSALSQFAAAVSKTSSPSDKNNVPEREFADRLMLALKAAGLPAPPLEDGLKQPSEPEAWLAMVALGGAPEAGRRVFFDTGGAGCARCHTVQGRGGHIGPDLTTIARTQNRRKLAESVLFPGKEVAPQFVTWSFVMKNGRVHNGLIVGENRGGTVRLGTSEGVLIDLNSAEIDERLPQKTSVMPDKLVDRLTAEEFRDLLSFLESLK